MTRRANLARETSGRLSRFTALALRTPASSARSPHSGGINASAAFSAAGGVLRHAVGSLRNRCLQMSCERAMSIAADAEAAPSMARASERFSRSTVMVAFSPAR